MYVLCQNFSVDELSGPASNFPETSESCSAAACSILTTHSDTSSTVVRSTFHLAFRPSSYDFLLAIRRAGSRYGSCERFKVSRRQTIELCSCNPLYCCVRSFSFL